MFWKERNTVVFKQQQFIPMEATGAATNFVNEYNAATFRGPKAVVHVNPTETLELPTDCHSIFVGDGCLLQW